MSTTLEQFVANGQAAQAAVDAALAENLDERLATLRKIAGELAEQNPAWTVFRREVLGADGLVRRLFPSPEARDFYRRSTTRLHVEGMLARLRDKSIDEAGEPTRVITVRLPASLHERLRMEAHDGHTSMNQLCITKLLQELPAEPQESGCQCPPGTVSRPEEPCGHYGSLRNGVVHCSYCHAGTVTDERPPFTIKCSGCARNVRVEPAEVKDGG